MAKSKKVSKKNVVEEVVVVKKNLKKESEIVNILLIPLSIVLAGIIIAATVLFAAKSVLDSENIVTKSNLRDEISLALEKYNLQPNTGNNNNNTQQTEPTPSTIYTRLPIGDGIALGSKEAKVGIIKYNDFNCGFCAKFHNESFEQIKNNFIDTGKILFVTKDYDRGAGNDQMLLGRCINKVVGPEKYYEANKYLFESYTGPSSIDQILQSINVTGNNAAQIKDCFDKKEFMQNIAADTREGQQAGIQGTPGFLVGKITSDGYIDGEIVPGAYPYSTFEQLFNKYLNQ